MIIPLVKSYKKSLNGPKNYREISIIPIFTKLLEYIILMFHPEIMDSHSNQFGFKSNSSTLHAEFIISETIKYYNNLIQHLIIAIGISYLKNWTMINEFPQTWSMFYSRYKNLALLLFHILDVNQKYFS